MLWSLMYYDYMSLRVRSNDCDYLQRFRTRGEQDVVAGLRGSDVGVVQYLCKLWGLFHMIVSEFPYLCKLWVLFHMIVSEFPYLCKLGYYHSLAKPSRRISHKDRLGKR